MLLGSFTDFSDFSDQLDFVFNNSFSYWKFRLRLNKPTISQSNGIFTEQSIFRYFSREKERKNSSSLHEHASVRIKPGRKKAGR